MVKTAAIIQARLGSERLPGKALLPLPFGGGKGILEHIAGRATAAPSIAQVVVATTTQAADDALQQLSDQLSIACFRGSANDVLDRFSRAAVKYKLDVIVRLTGDNPFTDPQTIEQAVQKHILSQVDYTITEGLPLGTNVEVITAAALARAADEAKEPADREHVTPYIRRNDSFSKQTLKLDSAIKELRLTVDYPSDYALASLLYERLARPNPLFTLDDVGALIAGNPWLASVNMQNSQRKAFASELEEFQEAEKVLKAGGFTRVLNKLKEVTDV